MRRKVLPLPGTGGSPPSNYDAPFEEEGKLFAALRPSSHVDEAGATPKLDQSTTGALGWVVRPILHASPQLRPR